jgi:hypothetical protein
LTQWDTTFKPCTLWLRIKARAKAARISTTEIYTNVSSQRLSDVFKKLHSRSRRAECSVAVNPCEHKPSAGL